MRRLVAEGAAYSSGDAGPLHSETIGARASDQGHRTGSPAPERLRLRHRLNVRRDLRNVEFLQECVVVRAA
jgi:hypothetical protein